jgi:hypothetical protein
MMKLSQLQWHDFNMKANLFTKMVRRALRTGRKCGRSPFDDGNLKTIAKCRISCSIFFAFSFFSIRYEHAQTVPGDDDTFSPKSPVNPVHRPITRAQIGK